MINSQNPLMSKVKLPGRVFTLPSKGLFYKPGEVLDASVRDGEVQVKPMSALTEVKLRSADLLLSGKIIREVCQECAPEIVNPERLVTKDVDALFVFLVASTYGSTKTVTSVHSCENAKVHDYQVSLDRILMNPRNECLAHRDVLYQVQLDNGQRVVLKPVQFRESIDIMMMKQEISRKERDRVPVSTEEVEDVIVADLMCVIEGVEDEVDGKKIFVTDRRMVSEWVRSLTKKQTDAIVRAANASADWGFDFHVPVKCKDCGAEYSHEMELNPVNFFSG